MMNVTRASMLAIGTTVMMLAASPAAAQTPPAAPTNAVLTTLTVKSDVDRAQIMKVMSAEVRETVKLYLDGKIQQWYARSDGKGVVFILNCATVAEAKALTDTLPLSKNKLADFEYMPLGPLTPLRFLLADPIAPKH
jgi:L-asparaginase/Glu-tRNA(Gln) amidotransferase subunit D